MRHFCGLHAFQKKKVDQGECIMLSQVTSTRKGLRNQIKTLLWRKPSSSSGSLAASGKESPRPGQGGSVHGGSVHGGTLTAANGAVYGGGTVEGQMRALADLAFMMQVCFTLRRFHQDRHPCSRQQIDAGRLPCESDVKQSKQAVIP